MKHFLILPAFFVTAVGALAQPLSDNPPYVPPPAVPKPHVSQVPQPDEAPAAPTSDDNIDPAKVASFQKRFAQGLDLEQQGKPQDALKVYDSILAEQPTAKGSLLHAGQICFEFDDMAKANDYFSKLHQLVPDFPDAIQYLILINQELKHDVKVELLARDFRTLHDSGKIPKLTETRSFQREVIPYDKDNIFVSQFFDYSKDPNTVWMAEVQGSDGQVKRRLLLNYDPAATQALRAKDPKYATTEVFNWMEHVIRNGKVTDINVYLQIFALPDYQKFRSAMLLILANPPKPIYSAPVGEASSQ